MEARPLVPVYVIQDMSSGSFLTADLGFARSLAAAGRLHDREEAVATAISQFGYDYEIHQFWELGE